MNEFSILPGGFMAVKIDEIAPDLFRLSLYVPQANLQFNQFLVRDAQPLLYHTGLRRMFPLVREAVARLIDPATLRWIGFSHLEADECGSLNEWLAAAPQAEPACGQVGAMVNVNDWADRKARILEKDEILETGRYRFRYLATPHVPHGWDAGLLFEETGRSLLCSDLFLQSGHVEPVTAESVIDRALQTLLDYQAGPLADSVPYTPRTDTTLKALAALKPQRLVAMHGSTFVGDGEQALLDLAELMKEVLGEKY
jgi:flavorubredoxin